MDVPIYQSAPMATAETARKIILIVEDDILLRHVIAEHLRSCGFDVVEAASLIEAKTIVQHEPQIHTLLCDARLTGEGRGFALAQWVRRCRPLIRVVLTSTLANKSRAVLAMCGKHGMGGATIRDRLNANRARGSRRAAPPKVAR